MTTRATIELPADPRYCPFCRSATKGRRFCPGCGHYVLTDLGDPTEAESIVDARRPSIWSGALIAIAGVLAVVGSFQTWVEILPYRDYVGDDIDATTWSGVDGMKDRISLGIEGLGTATICVGLILAVLGIARLSGRGSPLAIRLGAFACIPVLLCVVEAAFSTVNAFNTRIPGAEDPRPTVVGVGIFLIAFATLLAFIGAIVPGRKPD